MLVTCRGSRFGATNTGAGGGFGARERPPPPEKPAQRGFGRGVYARNGEEVAARDEGLEKELFANENTGINFDAYENIPAEATGNNVPPPVTSFEDAGLHPVLLENIRMAKFTKPTPIQRFSIAAGLKGRDLMACAQTGSGKTGAFLFPILTELLYTGKRIGDQLREEGARFPMTTPQALVIAPTRELAVQIYDECRKFAYRSWVRPVAIYGGADSIRQLRDMQDNGCHLMVCTPGRLNDLIERRKVSLRQVKHLVLDEADRMLDMGFEPQIRRIVERSDLPKQRQTLMFSATFPKEVQRLAANFLNDYVFLTIGRVGSTSSNITQNVEYIEEDDKHNRLLELLNQCPGLTLIFVQTKREADTLEQFLTRKSLPATAIHGDRQQWEREEALEEFRSGRKPYLVATDVASRGLDIPNVAHVVNFDMPATIDDYVHRIGRTGRVGKKGLATSFFNNQDTGLANDLALLLREVNQPVPDWLAACAAEMTGTGISRYKFGGRDVRASGSGGSYGSGGGNYSSGGSGFGGANIANSGGDSEW